MVEANAVRIPDPEEQDIFAGDVPERLEPDVIRELSVLSQGRSFGHIALEWSLIIAAAYIGWHFWHPLAYPVFVAFIGARQHALIVLAHDAAHYRLCRNRRLNDWLGEILLAWPFVLFTMQAYRRNHFPHHRHVNSDRDPDWVRKQTDEWRFPKTRTQLAWLLLTYASGVGFIRFIIVASKLPKTQVARDDREQRAFSRVRIAFILLTLAAITALHAWPQYLLFWVVPYVTWMQLCFQIRSIAEHFAISGRRGVFAETRTVAAGWFDRTFILPKNANYHLEHHLYPSVPFYRLPQLHALLMQRPGYRESAHISRGYFGVLRECVGAS
jgi:fatty acid desaturase